MDAHDPISPGYGHNWVADRNRAMRTSMKEMLAGVLFAMACATGCATYYQVHDPTTGKDYYTTDLRQMDSGATTLKDARTGNEVSVQNSEVKKITKEEFEAGKFTQPSKTSSSAYPATAPSR
jgi:hypothetical protein